MQKRSFAPRGAAVLLTALLALAGCAPRYNVILTNGNVISTRGKPKFDKASGAYNFIDSKGKPVSIPGFRVKEVAPPGMEEKADFGPVQPRVR